MTDDIAIQAVNEELRAHYGKVIAPAEAKSIKDAYDALIDPDPDNALTSEKSEAKIREATDKLATLAIKEEGLGALISATSNKLTREFGEKYVTQRAYFEDVMRNWIGESDQFQFCRLFGPLGFEKMLDEKIKEHTSTEAPTEMYSSDALADAEEGRTPEEENELLSEPNGHTKQQSTPTTTFYKGNENDDRMTRPEKNSSDFNEEGYAINKNGLIFLLKCYIARIESYNKKTSDNPIDFNSGFRVTAFGIQARNRRANYYLARALLTELENGEIISNVFKKDNLKDIRKPYNPSFWGIKSNELNNIIDNAECIMRSSRDPGKKTKVGSYRK